MDVLRSERYAAGMLLGAAAVALFLANLPFGPSLVDLRDAALWLGPLHLSAGHWISDGLLAVFFFLVAVELRHELTQGELATRARAVVPAIAALGGVVGPAAIYLAFTAGSGQERGWPVPTATDIAFALGVLAIFGSSLPSRVRAFLLALAVLDDLIAIVLIAVLFAQEPDLLLLVGAVVAVAAFGILSRLLRSRGRIPVAAGMSVVAVIAWYFVQQSGIHATIAGVALGLVMSPRPARRAYRAIEPFSNTVVLPLFAFSAALVTIPQVSAGALSPAFWGIVVGLPAGKIVGIMAAGGIAVWASHRRGGHVLERSELMVVGALGGIGFTVSLLMNELAFVRTPTIADQGTLAVLLGSAVSICGSALLLSAVSRRARTRRSPEGAPPPTR